LLLAAVGKLGHGPEAELFGRYRERLRPPLRMIEVAEARGTPVERKRREAAGLLAAVPPAAFVVALDAKGELHDSETFTALLTRWRESGRPLAFVIGGADGLDARVTGRADHLMSLGRMTWPHMLVRVMLAEQLYRARAIAAGHPYHRA
jgi:23S rRNA (pseudouridine1915-N3)-methyltransferase